MADHLHEYFAETAEFNGVVRDWGNTAANNMRQALRNLNAYKSGTLYNAIAAKVQYKFGEAKSIAFKFPRYGVFVEKGVGRGHGIASVASGSDALARHAKPWLNFVIETEIPKLADEAAKYFADKQINAFKIN